MNDELAELKAKYERLQLLNQVNNVIRSSLDPQVAMDAGEFREGLVRSVPDGVAAELPASAGDAEEPEIVEFVEVLKLDVAFLYDLLGASQEHKIKPKKFAQTDIDEVIIGHTNEPEFRKLQNNEFMEALRDRTVKIDIPYITKLHEEIRIYEKDLAAVRPGVDAVLRTMAFPGEEFRGRLVLVGGVMDEKTRTDDAAVSETAAEARPELEPGEIKGCIGATGGGEGLAPQPSSDEIERLKKL